MSVHEVTIGQFRQFVEAIGYKTEPERDGQGGEPLDGDGGPEIASVTWSSPGIPKLGAPPLGDDHPVTQITWNDAVAFCEWLSKQEGVTYRLPSEAEGEYACRAGTTTTHHTGDELKPDPANIPAHAPRQTAPVGRFPPNALGLHDRLGNVHEWCRDWYAPWYYAGSPPENALGPSTGSNRVIRSGSYRDSGRFVKSANRGYFPPAFRFYHTGFRAVRELQDRDRASATLYRHPEQTGATRLKGASTWVPPSVASENAEPTATRNATATTASAVPAARNSTRPSLANGKGRACHWPPKTHLCFSIRTLCGRLQVCGARVQIRSDHH